MVQGGEADSFLASFLASPRRRRSRAGDGPQAKSRRPVRCIDRFLTAAYIAAMALREIIILPDKRLRLRSEPVKAIDKEIKALVEDMFETMYDAPGIGLAAIQVAVPKRV